MDKRARWATTLIRTQVFSVKALSCVYYLMMCASAPILLDWLRSKNGGRFPIAIPALTFWAYGCAMILGLVSMLSRGRAGVKTLNRPDMLWRFCIVTSLLTLGDISSFMSLQHINIGTSSLVGKASGILFTVALTRMVLKRHQTHVQYSLLLAVVATTVAFCWEEARARQTAEHASNTDGLLMLGLAQRIFSTVCTALAAILQERFLTQEPGIPFLAQQVWMAIGALVTSLFVLHWVHNLPVSSLLEGFDDWGVWVLVLAYTANGLATGMVIKQLGAIIRALCTPVYLGICYAYAVSTGSAILTFQVVAPWLLCIMSILGYIMTKAHVGKKLESLGDQKQQDT